MGTTIARGLLAAAVCGVALAVLRGPLPRREEWGRLVVVALGAVIGFPLLTALALQTTTNASSAVVIAMLPIATAVFALRYTHERPGREFWLPAAFGGAVCLVYAISRTGTGTGLGYLYLAGALVVCGAAYAAGGSLSTRRPGWQVIAWAVVAATPVYVAIAAVAGGVELPTSRIAWVGLIYVAVVSQFIGFVFWYDGLARLGAFRGGQIQLLQPLLTFVWGWAFFGERLGIGILLATPLLLGSVYATQRARHRSRTTGGPVRRRRHRVVRT